MIYWNVKRRAAKRGWLNAYQLSQATGISQPAAKHALGEKPIMRLDTTALLILARALKCSPLALLVYRPE